MPDTYPTKLILAVIMEVIAKMMTHHSQVRLGGYSAILRRSIDRVQVGNRCPYHMSLYRQEMVKCEEPIEVDMDYLCREVIDSLNLNIGGEEDLVLGINIIIMGIPLEDMVAEVAIEESTMVCHLIEIIWNFITLNQ
jgi:hypothetical protein